MDSSKFLKGFFWLAFASFLAASIPHVAYFFRAFEPVATGAYDTLYWGISYAIAGSIDITIFLLSYTVAKMHRNRARGSLIFSVWVFIIGLAVLSFYVNFKYAQHFSSLAMISPTALDVPYIGTLGDINPYIASCFQILAIAYTWIADKIQSDEKQKTASELKAEADELEAMAIEQKRIADIKRGRKAEKTEDATGTITGLIQAGKKIAKEAMSREQNAGINPGLPPVSDGQNSLNEADKNTGLSPDTSQQEPGLLPTSEEQAASQTEVNTDELNPLLSPDTSPASEQETGELTAITGYDVIASWVSTGRKSATIEEVSQAINLSVKVLKRRVSKGVLKTTPRNPDLILLASVLDWLKGEQNGSKADTIPALKILSREDQTA